MNFSRSYFVSVECQFFAEHFRLGNQVLKTKACLARTLNPPWNEDLAFVAAEPFEEQLMLTVEDGASPTKDEILGEEARPLFGPLPVVQHGTVRLRRARRGREAKGAQILRQSPPPGLPRRRLPRDGRVDNVHQRPAPHRLATLEAADRHYSRSGSWRRRAWCP